MNTRDGIQLPDAAKPGKEIYASDQNLIVSALQTIIARLKKNQLVPSRDLSVSANATGTVANLRNAGGGTSGNFPYIKPEPLTITASRPSYIPTEGVVRAGFKRFYLTMGFTCGMRATNWQDSLDIPIAGNSEVHVAMKIRTASNGRYASCEWVMSADSADFNNARWNVSEGRPDYLYFFLGSIFTTDGVAFIQNNGAGCIDLYQSLFGIDSTGTDVTSVYSYAIIGFRLAF